MFAFLGWLESTGLATWTRESPSLWAYPTILTLHTVGLAMVVGASAVIALRLLGAGSRIPIATLVSLFPFIWIGFLINAASGLLLFIADATTKSQQTVFYVKLVCIAIALGATVMTRPLLASAVGSTLPAAPKGRALAAVSLLFWAGAILAGRLMAYLV
jgi:hypothetical protein